MSNPPVMNIHAAVWHRTYNKALGRKYTVWRITEEPIGGLGGGDVIAFRSPDEGNIPLYEAGEVVWREKQFNGVVEGMEGRNRMGVQYRVRAEPPGNGTDATFGLVVPYKWSRLGRGERVWYKIQGLWG